MKLTVPRVHVGIKWCSFLVLFQTKEGMYETDTRQLLSKISDFLEL